VTVPVSAASCADAIAGVASIVHTTASRVMTVDTFMLMVMVISSDAIGASAQQMEIHTAARHAAIDASSISSTEPG